MNYLYKININTSAKLLLILVITVFASCRKIETYPPEPIITYEGGIFEYSKDALGNNILLFTPKIHFTDGDGNIGSLINGKVTKPCDISYTHDYYINIYESINGIFVKRDFNENYKCIDSSIGIEDSLVSDNVGLNVFLTYMEGKGQSKSLIGDIENKMTLPTLKSDTVKFDFKLSDRNNTFSNVVESPIYIISEI